MNEGEQDPPRSGVDLVGACYMWLLGGSASPREKMKELKFRA